MNYNFTDRVRKVLAIAREEAIRLQHDYVDTEHMLLGLIQEGEGVAMAVLANLGVDLEKIREEVEETVEEGEAMIALGELPYTSQAKKVLEHTMAEARDLSHSYVGTEHILLGLFHVEEGIAAQILNSVGLELEETRTVTLKVLGSEDAPSESTEGVLDQRILELQSVIQVLSRRYKTVREDNEDLKARLDELEERLARLEEGADPP